MTQYGQNVNTDAAGKVTTAEYGDDGSGANRWVSYHRVANGGDAAQGATTDAEATGNGTVVAILKRLRTLLSGGLPAALDGSGGLKVRQQQAKTETVLVTALTVSSSATSALADVDVSSYSNATVIVNPTAVTGTWSFGWYVKDETHSAYALWGSFGALAAGTPKLVALTMPIGKKGRLGWTCSVAGSITFDAVIILE